MCKYKTKQLAKKKRILAKKKRVKKFLPHLNKKKNLKGFNKCLFF